MSANASIKKTSEKVHIAFGTANKPLGELSQALVNEFAIIAHESGREDYKEHFDRLPTLEQLKSGKTDEQLLGITPGSSTPEAAALAGPATPASVNATTESANAAAAAATAAKSGK